MTVEQQLEKLRIALGVTLAEFRDLTIGEILESERRDAWCAIHAGFRRKGCDWCSYLNRVEVQEMVHGKAAT